MNQCWLLLANVRLGGLIAFTELRLWSQHACMNRKMLQPVQPELYNISFVLEQQSIHTITLTARVVGEGDTSDSASCYTSSAVT